MTFANEDIDLLETLSGSYETKSKYEDKFDQKFNNKEILSQDGKKLLKPGIAFYDRVVRGKGLQTFKFKVSGVTQDSNLSIGFQNLVY